MKIGILSMQRIKNYGSFLQAFALKKTLESLGHEVEFVDIVPGRQLPGYEYTVTRMSRFIEIITKGRVNIYAIHRRLWATRYRKSFDYYFDELGVNKHTFEVYDCVVIGSDEVFNIAQSTPWGYTSQLYGNVPNARKVISYAGSFGQTSIELICRNDLEIDMTNALRKMFAISVRDDNSRILVEKLLQSTPSVNIDPVFIFDFSKNIVETQENGYMLIYSYPGRINEKGFVRAIKKFAKKHHKKIFSIGSFYEWADKNLLPHPFEVLSYFKNADYIVTDTFHGSIMSIKYNKQFAVLIRESNRNKIKYLLDLMKLESRTLECCDDMESMLLKSIDYSDTNAVIMVETKKALDYLNRNLDGERK